MTTSMKLTRQHWRQKEVLERLARLHKSYPNNPLGFTLTGRDDDRALCRRALEPLGLVEIKKGYGRSFLYSLTPAGRAAISGGTNG